MAWTVDVLLGRLTLLTMSVAARAQPLPPDSGAAEEGSVAVVPEEGVLRPGRAAVVRVAVAGLAPGEHPTVGVQGGSARPLGEVDTYLITPGGGASEVEVTVTSSRGTRQVHLPVRAVPGSALRVPPRVDAVAGDPTVPIPVTGDDLPDPAALQVVASEGTVVRVEVAEGGLRVILAPEDLPFPRVIAVGVRDTRGDEAPRWVELRLRARPALPLRSDPGSLVTVRVGWRSYGPFPVDAQGSAVARVEQFPGEVVATATFEDELGNRSSTDLPLAVQTQSLLVPMIAGELASGVSPPTIFVRGLRLDGRPFGGDALSCRTPSVDLQVVERGPGEWEVPLIAGPTFDSDLRVECAAGAIKQSLRVPLQPSIPSRLVLRVWPAELRTDFPNAEVRVVLEDTSGERLPVEGVVVSAERGQVVLEPPAGGVVRGEYRGAGAVAAGEDVVRAEYTGRAAAAGVVRDLELSWTWLPSRSGELRVHGRALDATRLPVEGVKLALDAGGRVVEAVTGPDGWASGEVQLAGGGGPVVARVAGARLVRQRPIPTAGAPPPGPGVPDLLAMSQLRLSPGRVAGITVEVDPPVLRASPGAVALITVHLEDRSGNPIVDVPPAVSASTCCVGGGQLRRDGAWTYEFAPEEAERVQEVTISAATDTLRSSTTLELEPRVLRWSVGPWAGVQTNFGGITTPTVGLDLDLRLRTEYLGESAVVRLGLATYSFESTVGTGLGAQARATASTYPLTGALLFRQDLVGVGIWGGLGMVVSPTRTEVGFGDVTIANHTTVPFGPALLAGASTRALGGELVVAARASSVTATEGELGFTGNIGGVGIGAGYRLLF